MTDPDEITEPMPMWMWCDEDPHPLRPGCTRSHHNIEIMQNYRLRARLEASVSVQNAVILHLCEVANALGIPSEMSNDPPAMTRETAARILALRGRLEVLEAVATAAKDLVSEDHAFEKTYSHCVTKTAFVAMREALAALEEAPWPP